MTPLPRITSSLSWHAPRRNATIASPPLTSLKHLLQDARAERQIALNREQEVLDNLLRAKDDLVQAEKEGVKLWKDLLKERTRALKEEALHAATTSRLTKVLIDKLHLENNFHLRGALETGADMYAQKINPNPAARKLSATAALQLVTTEPRFKALVIQECRRLKYADSANVQKQAGHLYSQLSKLTHQFGDITIDLQDMAAADALAAHSFLCYFKDQNLAPLPWQFRDKKHKVVFDSTIDTI